tara:strand:- start:81 stop:392 length:312 start_codon:yes stop_codon:yes gene_type:complete
MKYLVLASLFATSAMAADNSAITFCKEKHGYNGLNNSSNLMQIAACIDSERNAVIHAEEDRIWEFLKENPHYRYSGMALPAGAIRPLPKCWGMNRKYGDPLGC